MIYTFMNLKMAGFLVGIALILGHVLALRSRESVRKWLLSFPRSHVLGVALLVTAAIWSFLLVAEMDLGEFTSYRTGFLMAIPVAAGLTIRYVEEFLAVRATGMLMLLAAEPVLEAAFLRPEKSRLLLVVLAYAWTIFGMFWVGMPYLMRDQIKWLLKSESRWNAAMYLGLAYGVAILICTLAFYPAA
jgi:hypothetical protein